jgi:hypothetical protein
MNFLQDVDRWIDAEQVEAAYEKRNYIQPFTSKRTSQMFYVKPGVKSLVDDNSDQYTMINERGQTVLVDRGIPEQVDGEVFIEDLLKGRKRPTL